MSVDTLAMVWCAFEATYPWPTVFVTQLSKWELFSGVALSVPVLLLSNSVSISLLLGSISRTSDWLSESVSLCSKCGFESEMVHSLSNTLTMEGAGLRTVKGLTG